MSRIRDLRRQVRGDLHREMSVPGLYIAATGATPVPCNVRVWRKRAFPVTGEQDAGQLVVSEDRIRFRISELPNIRRVNAVVSVEPGEAYRCEFYYPVDGEYQTARVVVLSEDDAAGLPVPGLVAQTPTSQTIVILPAGGEAGDVLRKRTSADFDFQWVRGSFTFTQSTAATIWTIPHNLGRIPVVSVVGPDGHEMEGEVSHSAPDYNTTTISFLMPTVGLARLA